MGFHVRWIASRGKARKELDALFDVPAELSKALTGFRHDEDIDGVTGDAFTVLERT